MQKLGFAIKIFGIIILIPVWIILEVNHALPDNKQHPLIDGKDDKTTIQLSLHAKAQSENPIPVKIHSGLTAR